MDGNRCEPVLTGRRAFVGDVCALLVAALTGRIALGATGAYSQTLAALMYAFQRETDAHRRYVEWGGIATHEGYRGIAYMFAAFAVSEGLHARHFGELVARLGGQASAKATDIRRGTTKENLIAAVDDEMDSIDVLYPQTLERLKPEGEPQAALFVKYAWESERQHRDLIQKIRRYSPLMFDRVAKTIDEKTGLYFVCEACGSTLNRVPSPACPVCAGPAGGYRKVPIAA
jgi:rubrerythrin